MGIEQLCEILKSLGYPVAYYEFKQPPTIPYIVYSESGATSYGDDFKNYIIRKTYAVELYTDKKSPQVEQQIEDALIFVEWTKNENYISDEKLIQTTYEFEIITRKGV